MLEVRDLEVRYGAIRAVRGISFSVSGGELVALLGANGAGKSTVLKAVSGLIPLAGGKIVWKGDDITAMKAEDRVKLGIAQVPGGRGLFPSLTVGENLRMGGFLFSSDSKVESEAKRVMQYFPWIEERENQPAGTLSGGEQQQLATARALNREGITCLLVEQNVALSLKLASRAYVLENGRISLSGTGADLLADDRVRQAYLGL